MNKEEIEEIETLEIDFKDTDELELALEVSSKKAIYLIDDLIKHLFELQQENQSLKKENKILRENAEHNDKVVDKVYWENLKLKKQLEEYKRLGFKHLNDKCNKLEKQLEDTNEELELVRCDLHNRTSERDGYYRNIEILENQQKEFIEWLTNEANINPYDISDYVYENIINTILSKYYEIIDK